MCPRRRGWADEETNPANTLTLDTSLQTMVGTAQSAAPLRRPWTAAGTGTGFSFQSHDRRPQECLSSHKTKPPTLSHLPGGNHTGVGSSGERADHHFCSPIKDACQLPPGGKTPTKEKREKSLRNPSLAPWVTAVLSGGTSVRRRVLVLGEGLSQDGLNSLHSQQLAETTRPEQGQFLF